MLCRGGTPSSCALPLDRLLMPTPNEPLRHSCPSQSTVLRTDPVGRLGLGTDPAGWLGLGTGPAGRMRVSVEFAFYVLICVRAQI